MISEVSSSANSQCVVTRRAVGTSLGNQNFKNKCMSCFRVPRLLSHSLCQSPAEMKHWVRIWFPSDR